MMQIKKEISNGDWSVIVTSDDGLSHIVIGVKSDVAADRLISELWGTTIEVQTTQVFNDVAWEGLTNDEQS